VYLAREAAESKSSMPIFCTLSDIGDISDRFTIEIGETPEAEERASIREISDILDNTGECRVDIGLIELSLE
jgi:hypothetical protein